MATSGEQMAPEFERAQRRFQLLLGALVVVGAVVLFLVLREPPAETTPEGLQSGLVFAACDEPLLGLSRPSVELWQIDPASGTQEQHVGIDLPPNSRLTFPCDTVGGLARRLFDTTFEHVVVGVRDPSTGAEQVHQLGLADGENRMLTPQPDGAFAPHPRNELPVFGSDGQTVWYRATNDGTINTVGTEPGAQPQIVASLEPASAGPSVVDDLYSRIMARTDPAAQDLADELALPNPTGDLALGEGEVLVVGGATRQPTCATTGAPAVADCLPAGIALGGSVRPAAWLDDRTLLVIYGMDRGVNTLLRVEIDDRARMRVCQAIPPSDWFTESVAVAPDGERYAFVAARDGQRRMFVQPTDAGVEQQPALLGRVEVPGGAQLIGWQPIPPERPAVAHICPRGALS